MMFFLLWVLPGLLGAAWVCKDMIPHMVDDMTYGDTIDLGTVMIIMMVLVIAAMCGGMMGPTLPAFYGMALIIQKLLNARIKRNRY